MQFGCIRQGPLPSPLLTGTDGQEYKLGSPANGYSIVEDTNAGLYTDDNAQDVTLVAPTPGHNQSSTGSLSFLNNFKSNTNFFMQDGMAIPANGSGFLDWADDLTTPYPDTAQPYGNLTYVAGRSYTATITRTNGVWWYCVYDNVTHGQGCMSRSAATGTNLLSDVNTSVFAENANATPSNWYSGFSSPLQAYNAHIYRNQVGQPWSAQHRHTADACASGWYPFNSMTGSLVNGGTVSYWLTGVPYKC